MTPDVLAKVGLDPEELAQPLVMLDDSRPGVFVCTACCCRACQAADPARLEAWECELTGFKLSSQLQDGRVGMTHRCAHPKVSVMSGVDKLLINPLCFMCSRGGCVVPRSVTLCHCNHQASGQAPMTCRSCAAAWCLLTASRRYRRRTPARCTSLSLGLACRCALQVRLCEVRQR